MDVWPPPTHVAIPLVPPHYQELAVSNIITLLRWCKSPGDEGAEMELSVIH